MLGRNQRATVSDGVQVVHGQAICSTADLTPRTLGSNFSTQLTPFLVTVRLLQPRVLTLLELSIALLASVAVASKCSASHTWAIECHYLGNSGSGSVCASSSAM